MPDATLLMFNALGSSLASQLAFLGLDDFRGLLAIVLGFGVLIFVHELGHFLAAKWAGVRVEVFSLGFGPRLFGFERGTTDYRVSALPLGGYVKMLGQDDSDPTLQRTDLPDDFRNQTAFKRMVILIAGVVMNTIFAVIAFIAAFAVGAEFTAPEVGYVEPNRAAARARIVGDASGQKEGLQPGDQILKINNSEILAFEDIQTVAALSNGRTLIEVARPGPNGLLEKLTFEATPQRDDDETIQRLGIGASQIVTGFADDSVAKQAGMRVGDEILDVAPAGSTLVTTPGARQRLFPQVIEDNASKPLDVMIQRRAYDDDGRPKPVPPEQVVLHVTPLGRPVWGIGVEMATEARITGVEQKSPARGILEPEDTLVSIDGHEITAASLRDVVKAVGDQRGSVPVPIVFKRTTAGKEEVREAKVALDRLANGEGWFLGVRFAAQRVKSVAPGSPAAKAGIEAGDLVTTVKKDRLLKVWWRGSHAVGEGGGDTLRAVSTEMQERPWKVIWQKPDGKVMQDVVVAEKTSESLGDLGIELGARTIILRRGAAGACVLGVDRTVRMIQQLGQTIRGLVARNVSTKELGGPIQIATITYKIAQVGFGKLLYFLAILSVNLAVLNILPIPVLDGGHLLLLLIEKLKGRPLSDDVLRYVQYGGLLFVIGLMAYVTFNDIRRWFE